MDVSGIDSLPGHIDGVTATVTTQVSPRLAVRMLDGSGLDAAGNHGKLLWNNPGGTGSPPDFLTGWDSGANRPIQTVRFNLHGDYDLGSIHVWNFIGIKGAQNVEPLVADDFGGALTSLGDFVFHMEPVVDYPGQDIDLSAFNLQGTSEVQFIITTNWVDAVGAQPGEGGWLMGGTSVHNNSRTGLNEVQFFDGAAIPEPSSLMLGLLGLLGFGSFARRRRRR